MKKIIIIALVSLITACNQGASNEINLYSARKEALMQPLLDAFTKQTDITVNIISSKADALLTRIESEGINSPADVLLTTDAGRLHRAKAAGITTVAFDRSGFKYHGRVKALADAAREGGLEF